MISRATWQVLPLLLTLALVGCGDSQSKRSDTLTQRERDSILAASRIPGAPGVGAAMRAADATSRGIHAADSVSP
jgi:hypothetical protein